MLAALTGPASATASGAPFVYERRRPEATTPHPSSAAQARTASDPLEDILKQELPYDPRARDEAPALFDRRYVSGVLEANGGNVPRAALASGIARRYFNIVLARTKT